MGEDTHDETGPGSVLVVDSGGTEPCTAATAVDVRAPADVSGVFVAIDQTPDEALDAWRDVVGSAPVRFGVVAVGDRTRSAAAESPPSVAGADQRSVACVSGPDAVDDVGFAVMDYLDRWPPGEVVLVVDGLASVVRATDVQTAFRFVHVLVHLLSNAGGRVVACIDADACGPRDVATLRPLFDAVYDADRSP